MQFERKLAMFLLAWTLVHAFFLSSAFRIDEPNIIAIAQQIAEEPLDPYGFTINWNGTEESAFTTLANPPLVPAWLAVWASVFGWSETSLHLAMLPFSLIALAAFASIARDLEIGTPVIAAAALACSPAFFLSSQVVMPDVAMVAFLAASVAFVLRFRKTARTSMLAMASICAALTPLMKYNGVIVVPVLLAFWAISKERRGALTIPLFASVAGLGLWSLAGIYTHGEPHVIASSRLQGGAAVSAMNGALIGFALGVLPFALAFRTPRPPAIGKMLWRAMLVVVALVLAVLARTILGYGFVPSLLFAAGGAIGLHFIIGAVWRASEDWKNGSKSAAVLVAWILVTFALQFQLLFTAVRYLLPLSLPAILLALREVKDRRALASALALNAVFVVALAIGDARTANLYREFVEREVEPLVTDGSLYFDGHWGLQHYASRPGGEAVDRRSPPELRPGDVLIRARNPFPAATSPEPDMTQVVFEADPGWPLRTIDCEGAANFYGNAIGGCRFFPVYLPFAIGSGPVETFTIVRGASR